MKKNILRVFLVFVFVVCATMYILGHFEDVYAAELKLEEVQTLIEEQQTQPTSPEVFEEEEEILPTFEAVVEAEAETETEEMFGEIYCEGDAYGIVDYNGNQTAVAVGTTKETLDGGQAMLHSASTESHLVILGHSTTDGSIFGRLYSNSKVGTEVKLTTLSGVTKTYEVVSTEWVSEEEYNTSDYVMSIFEDESPLMLITCRKNDGVRGRWIVRCDIKTEE